MYAGTDRADLVARLRDEIASRFTGRVPSAAIPTGWPALDRLLHDGGVRRGSLVEVIGERAETVAAALTRACCRASGAVVVVDRERQFHPPALAAWGVPLDRQVVVRAEGDADALWAAVQSLRCPAVTAVWLWADRLRPNDARLLQLAAEDGGALGILLLPARARGQPGWADVQLCVEPLGRSLRLVVTRSRGRTAAAVVVPEYAPCETPDGLATAQLASPAAAG